MKNILTIAILSLLFGFVGLEVVAACQPKVTPTPVDVCINLEGVQVTVPDGYFGVEGVCTPTITPTISPEVTEMPEASPSAAVTVDPTNPPAGHGDGLSDGRSDGRSSCPSCTATPVIPSGAPATGKGL